jgi:hypothetical protein
MAFRKEYCRQGARELTLAIGTRMIGIELADYFSEGDVYGEA